MARHPLLFGCWCLLFAMAIVGVGAVHGLIIVVLLIAPLLANLTRSSMLLRDDDVLLPRVAPAYRATFAANAVACAVGLVATLAHVRGLAVEHGPLALLFLVGLVTSWRAIVAPTPRRAAAPGAFALVAWGPLAILNFVIEQRVVLEGWQVSTLWVAGIAMLVLGAIGCLISIIAFEDGSDLPRATLAPAA